MILVECKNLLLTTYQANNNVSRSVSFWQRQAWWEQITECLDLFETSNEDVLLFMKRIEAWIVFTKIGEETNTIENTSTSQLESSSVSSFFTDFWSQAGWYLQMLWYMLWLLLLWYLLFRIIRYLIIFLYDVLNNYRVVYLKILQTRWDSKSERDMQKELAKDMKEKISRMSQVYNNLHKLWQLSVKDNVLRFFFKKPKLTLIYQYEEWKLFFIIGVYPEYQSILEGAISAQYSEASIETIDRPNFFKKKYSDIIPLEPTKEWAYTIKIYKQMPDDPLNNIIDSIGKVSRSDTISIVIPIKPEWKSFNKRAQFVADALYRRKTAWLDKTKWRQFLLMPRKIIDFLINGPNKDMIEKPDNSTSDWMVRMVKTQEESYNTMAEEASNWWFKAWLLLISSSDNEVLPKQNLNSLISTFSIFTDQYANSLEHPEWMADIFGFIFKPLWRFAARFHLPDFFYGHNVFSVNELCSIFHLPDGIYNRSPSISWLDYKILPWPENLPQFAQDDWNWFVMWWSIAETFQWGKLNTILKGSKHRAVGSKIIKEEKLVPIENYAENTIWDKEIVEKDSKKFVKEFEEKTVWWYKMFRWWVLLWINIYRNYYSPIYFKRDDRTRHHYCIWKSGTWKSVYLQTIARQDIWNGDWCCIIDPHWDLAEDTLEFIPKERAKDVIFFDAWDEERPMWLNLYEISNIDQADRTVNDATEIFLKMFWSEIFWPRIQEYFKYWSLTLLEDFEDKPTLLDVPRLYTDESYREFKTKKVKNAVVKNFREKTYNAMWDREKQEIIPYFTSKFVSFNTNRLIRNIIWQTKSAFTFEDVMNNQKVLLVSLSKGKIWEINAQLLWMIMVSKLYNAAMWRASMAKEDRKDFYLYVDEFQNFVSWTFADILSEARKYRLCLVMAHQYIAQLESWSKDWWWKADVKAAVFGNCWTIQSFKVGAPDAEFLEKEYAPILWAQDIIWVSNYKAYIKLNIDNTTSRVFSMTSIYTNDYKNKKIAWILKEYSSKKYWRKRSFVDAEIIARLWLDSELTWEEEIPTATLSPVNQNPVDNNIAESQPTVAESTASAPQPVISSSTS